MDICLTTDKIIREKMEGKMLEWTGEPDEEKLNELISLSFGEKEKIAMDIVKDSIINAKNPVICFAGEKKSLVLLHLVKQSYVGAFNVQGT